MKYPSWSLTFLISFDHRHNISLPTITVTHRITDLLSLHWAEWNMIFPSYCWPDFQNKILFDVIMKSCMARLSVRERGTGRFQCMDYGSYLKTKQIVTSPSFMSSGPEYVCLCLWWDIAVWSISLCQSSLLSAVNSSVSPVWLRSDPALTGHHLHRRHPNYLFLLPATK